MNPNPLIVACFNFQSCTHFKMTNQFAWLLLRAVTHQFYLVIVLSLKNSQVSNFPVELQIFNSMRVLHLLGNHFEVVNFRLNFNVYRAIVYHNVKDFSFQFNNYGLTREIDGEQWPNVDKMPTMKSICKSNCKMQRDTTRLKYNIHWMEQWKYTGKGLTLVRFIAEVTVHSNFETFMKTVDEFFKMLFEMRQIFKLIVVTAKGFSYLNVNCCHVRGCFGECSWENCCWCDNASQMNWTKEHKEHLRKSDDWLNQNGWRVIANYIMNNCKFTKLQRFGENQLTFFAKIVSRDEGIRFTKWITFSSNGDVFWIRRSHQRMHI